MLKPLNPCPDEEGIKTNSGDGADTLVALNPCPDEEGIKTTGERGLRKQSL